MATKKLKKQVLQVILDKPGISYGEIYKKFKDVLVMGALEELFYQDKMFAKSSIGGCYPCLDAKSYING